MKTVNICIVMPILDLVEKQDLVLNNKVGKKQFVQNKSFTSKYYNGFGNIDNLEQ